MSKVAPLKLQTTILFLVFLTIFSCQEDKTIDCTTENDYQITLPNGDLLTVPACWKHLPLQGDDAYWGKIIYEKEGILIFYDIGEMAGCYVHEDSPNKIVEESENEEFWYEVVDRQYLSDENCCVFITFHNRGPANFITPNDENFNKVLEVLKSYHSI